MIRQPIRLILLTPVKIVNIPRADEVIKTRNPSGFEISKERMIKNVIIEIEMYL